MVSIKAIYSRAFAVIRKKPLQLWGISLLCILLTGVAYTLCGVIPVLALAIDVLLETAMVIIFLRGYRGEEIAVTQLFDTFRDWKTIKRVLCGMGWQMLWVFLWSLIPVVGPVFGVIRMYEYRFTPYILMFEPEVPVTEAIKLSKQKTNGFKGKMFGADILYGVGVTVVCILLALLSRIPYIGILFALVLVVFAIAAAVFGPLFLGLVQAAFYEEVNNRKSCPRCGTPLAPGARFCPRCGLSADGTPALASPAAVCPNCGAPVTPGTAFCSQCGSPIA